MIDCPVLLHLVYVLHQMGHEQSSLNETYHQGSYHHQWLLYPTKVSQHIKQAIHNSGMSLQLIVQSNVEGAENAWPIIKGIILLLIKNIKGLDNVLLAILDHGIL